MICGHLRVYHAKGLPEGEFEERQGACLLCEIEHLRAYQQQMNNILKENERLRAELHRIRNDSLVWAMACEHNCPECDAMYESIKAYPTHPDPTGKTREPPHCPTCECGGPPQIRQLCPECLGYMPCAQHPTTDGA